MAEHQRGRSRLVSGLHAADKMNFLASGQAFLPPDEPEEGIRWSLLHGSAVKCEYPQENRTAGGPDQSLILIILIGFGRAPA